VPDLNHAPQPDEPKPLSAHFGDLRLAVMYPLIVWAVAMVLGIIFQNQVVKAVMYPMLKGIEKAKALHPDKFQFGLEKLTPQPERRIYTGPNGELYVLRQNLVSKLGGDLTPHWNFRFGSPVLGLALSSDGQRAAAAAQDGQLAILDSETGKPKAIEHVTGVADLRFSRDGKSLIIVRMNGEVLGLGRDGGELATLLPTHKASFPRLLTMTHEPMAVLVVIIKAALIFGLLPGIPCLMFYLWRFVRPGLRDREPQTIWRLLVFMMALFVLGASFAYFVVLPVVSMFLYLLSADVAMPIWNITKVVDMTVVLVLMFGLVFQLPLLIIFLTYFDIVRPAQLAHHRKVLWLATFIVAALLTPPDPISQALMAIPTVLLFEVGLVLSRFLIRKRERAEARTA